MEKLTIHWQNLILKYPRSIIVLTCIACGFSFYYASQNLRVNTDTTNIVSPDLPFQQDRKHFLTTFPQDDQAILVVVDSKTPEQTNNALSYLGKAFAQVKQQITSVYIPGEGDYFDKHGLLYLGFDDLNELAQKLTEAQPFIGTLSKDNSLKGFLSIINLALTTKDQELPVNIDFLLDKIRAAIQANLADKDYRLSWQQMMFGTVNDVLTTQRFILLKPKLDFSTMVPAEKPLKAVRAIIDQTKTLYPDTRIRITGEVVLEHEELETVERSATLASVFSVVLVCISLLIGYRSIKLTVITLIVMLMGSTLTAGFAAFAIGHLNLISISFMVLYIGIADDFAVQLCLRYRELVQENLPKNRALSLALQDVRPSTILCAITAAIGFFSFIPTAYAGVSELGIIAGVGIFIALAISMVVLPAMLSLISLDKAKASQPKPAFPDWVYCFPIRHRVAIRWTAILLTAIGLSLLTKARFDFNPLNLRDPKSESITTFNELLKTKETSPMTLTVLTPNKTQALETTSKLKQLPSVENAITIFDYIPDNQDEKIAVLEELALVLGIQITEFPPLQEDKVENQILALKNLQMAIASESERSVGNNLSESKRLLNEVLSQLLIKLESEPYALQKARLDKLQLSLLDNLQATMNRLFKGLQAGNVSIDTLPMDLTERWVNKYGIYRIMVFPKQDLSNLVNMKTFIEEVRKIAPNATDLPVIYLETGNAVVKAFQQALLSALLAITVVLLIVQRSLKQTLLILLPLLMAAIFTGASTVIAGKLFNFANIIIIPLLFGLGADACIFMMLRLRNMPSQQENVLDTSTVRGVIFSNLTTLCSLVSMAFTPHLGLASMGQLLAIGVGLMLLCTLLILPAFARNRL